MPVCLLNAVEKLPKFPKPRSSAISVIDFRVPNTSSTAAAITVLWAYRQDAHNMTGNLSSRIEVYLCRSEEHTSELQSLMRISYAVFCLKKKITTNRTLTVIHIHKDK